MSEMVKKILLDLKFQNTLFTKNKKDTKEEIIKQVAREKYIDANNEKAKIIYPVKNFEFKYFYKATNKENIFIKYVYKDIIKLFVLFFTNYDKEQLEQYGNNYKFLFKSFSPFLIKEIFRNGDYIFFQLGKILHSYAEDENYERVVERLKRFKREICVAKIDFAKTKIDYMLEIFQEIPDSYKNAKYVFEIFKPKKHFYIIKDENNKNKFIAEENKNSIYCIAEEVQNDRVDANIFLPLTDCFQNDRFSNEPNKDEKLFSNLDFSEEFFSDCFDCILKESGKFCIVGSNEKSNFSYSYEDTKNYLVNNTFLGLIDNNTYEFVDGFLNMSMQDFHLREAESYFDNTTIKTTQSYEIGYGNKTKQEIKELFDLSNEVFERYIAEIKGDSVYLGLITLVDSSIVGLTPAEIVLEDIFSKEISYNPNTLSVYFATIIKESNLKYLAFNPQIMKNLWYFDYETNEETSSLIKREYEIKQRFYTNLSEAGINLNNDNEQFNPKFIEYYTNYLRERETFLIQAISEYDSIDIKNRITLRTDLEKLFTTDANSTDCIYFHNKTKISNPALAYQAFYSRFDAIGLTIPNFITSKEESFFKITYLNTSFENDLKKMIESIFYLYIEVLDEYPEYYNQIFNVLYDLAVCGLDHNFEEIKFFHNGLDSKNNDVISLLQQKWGAYRIACFREYAKAFILPKKMLISFHQKRIAFVNNGEKETKINESKANAEALFKILDSARVGRLS